MSRTRIPVYRKPMPPPAGTGSPPAGMNPLPPCDGSYRGVESVAKVLRGSPESTRDPRRTDVAPAAQEGREADPTEALPPRRAGRVRGRVRRRRELRDRVRGLPGGRPGGGARGPAEHVKGRGPGHPAPRGGG